MRNKEIKLKEGEREVEIKLMKGRWENSKKIKQVKKRKRYGPPKILVRKWVLYSILATMFHHNGLNACESQ